MADEGLDVSAGSVAATIGAALLVALAGLALYIDGVVLVYVGFIQPGVPTVFAVAYVALAVVVPFWVGRNMRRRGSTWRRTIASSAGLVLGVSVAFFPIVVVALSM